LVLFLGIALIGGLLFLFVWGPWSPANRARAQAMAASQELYQLSPFTILNQVSEEWVDLNGCRINLIALNIGSPVPLTESVSLFTNAVQKIGWIRQPDEHPGSVSYFKRAPGEALVLFSENIGKPADTGNYAARLYVQVWSGTTYTGFCDNF
jgi:hypothetical protein